MPSPTARASRPAARHLAPLLAAAVLAAGCSSSSDEPTVALTGSVFAAPVSGATVTVRDAAGAAVAAPATSAADGSFTVNVPQGRLSQALFVEASGGTFTDEASGQPLTAGALLAHAAGGTLQAGAALHLTPQSTVVARMVQAGATRAEAEAAFQAAFGFTPDAAVAPANAPLPASPAVPTAAELDRARVAVRAAAFSRLTMDLGLPPTAQFDLLAALARDAADGSLDGQAAGGSLAVGGVSIPADVQNRFVGALMAWQADQAGNQTRLPVDQLGIPPFARVALTASYRIEWMDGPAPVMGRSLVKLRVRDAASGDPVPGLTLGFMPKMHMTTKSHATAMDPVADNGDGTYQAQVYFVMPTSMDGVVPQGVWELGVTVGGMGGEKATFYPVVGTPADMMANTPLVRLSGSTADMIVSMTGPAKRTYQLFHDGVAMDGVGTATFGVLVTTMDTMMTFPHVYTGATLNRPSAGDQMVMAPFTVGTVTVEVSADGGAYAPASHDGNGHYRITGLTGFAAGSSKAVQVRLTVGDEVKTTQSITAPESFATFTVTPAAAP